SGRVSMGFLRNKLITLRQLGPKTAFQFWWLRMGSDIRRHLQRRRPRLVQITPPTSLYPLWMRLGTSDVDVYRQVFLEQEYGCLAGVDDAKFIVDCGANVGFSAAYLLSRYKDAALVAAEPDAENFGMLQRNTAPFGDRIHALRAGIWSHTTGLSV